MLEWRTRGHAFKDEHTSDVMPQCLMAFMPRSVVDFAQQVHHHRTQERKQWRSVADGLPVSIFVQLRISRPMPLVLNRPPLTDLSWQGFWLGPQAVEEVLSQ